MFSKASDPAWLRWIVAPYAALFGFTFYALTILDEDYALWLLLLCGVIGIALIALMAKKRLWLIPVVIVGSITVAWLMARYYFSWA